MTGKVWLTAGLALVLISCTASEQPVSTDTSMGASAAWTASPSVKKSRRGVCHELGTANYSKTTDFESFSTLEQCLHSGGRLPAAAGQGSGALPISCRGTASAISPSSPNYDALRDYRTFESMNACRDAGGREYR